jgi:hypothetical protein
MRCSAWSSLVISVCSALLLAAPAAAHVTVMPHFIAAGATASLRFSMPNELDRPMTGFSLLIPGDFRIVAVSSAEGWNADVQGRRVTWTGGSLDPADEAAFAVELEAPTAPGPANLEAEQLYPGDGALPWAVELTVTPASDTPSQNLAVAAVIALMGLLVLSALGLAILKRTRSLQEK